MVMATIKHYDLTVAKLSSILKTGLKKKQEYPIQLPAKVEGSSLTYLTLAPYPGQELYVIAAPLRKSLKTRIMVGGHARNDYYHITSHEGKSVDAVKRFLPVKSFLSDTEEPITYKVNANKHCLESENFDLFLHVYRATRLPKQSDDQINKYLLQLYNQSNNAYHQGTGESTISDTSFDQLRKYLINEGLVKKEAVGAAPTPTSKKVDLKTPLGSLENAFTTEDIAKFFKKYPSSTKLISTPKIDGISGQVNYVKGILTNGNTKGDGYVGEDITALLKLVPGIPKKLNSAQNIEIRCELFMYNSTFEKKYGKNSGRDKPFANPRNLVAGLKNRKIPDPAMTKDISVLGYSIIGSNKDKSAQLEELKSLGFPVVDYKVFTLANYEKADTYLTNNRANLDYYQDGLVVDINDSKYRNNYIGSGINPAYAVAYKVDTGEATTVRGNKWTISKDGYFKPTILIDPVIVDGAKVSKISVHNAKKVKDQGLGPGAQIIVIRAGSAIPHVKSVIKPAKPQWPKETNWKWNSSGVDIVLNEGENSDSQEIERIKTFFSALNVERFSGGLIEAFYNAGIKTIPDILHVTKDSILKQVPRQGNTSAQNIVNEFKKLKTPGVSLPDLMYASGCFGRGLGKNKMYDLYKEYGDNLISGWNGSRLDDIANSISDLHGFSYATGKQFALGIKSYIDFYKSVKDVIYVKPKYATKSGILSGQVVAFTEFRNKDLAQKIVENGGAYSDSLTGKTTILLIPRKGVISTKTQKAKPTVTIMSLDEFKAKYKL